MNKYKKQDLSNEKHSKEQLYQNIFKNRYDRIGFNRKKRAKNPIRLTPLGIGNNIEVINRIEQELLKDIRDIDLVLQKRQSNMTYIHGFLLTAGISNQLIKEFHSTVQVSPDAVEDGFYLWRLKQDNQNYELASSKLVHSPRRFPQKLLDKSIQNIQNYDYTKHQQSLGKCGNRWNTSVKANIMDQQQRIKRFKTEFQPRYQQKFSIRKLSNANLDRSPRNYAIRRKMTDFKQVSENYKSHSHPLQLQSNAPTKRSKQIYSRTQSLEQAPSLQQLTTMLKKQAQVVSIWLPPSSCPQLMGIISIQIKQKCYNAHYCLIKKYYWYRYGLSRRLFDSILQWIYLQFDSVVELAIITNRDSFNTLFSPIGWHLTSWIADDRIKISYSGF